MMRGYAQIDNIDDVLRHICIWAGGVRAREDIELTRLDKVTIVHQHLVI